MDAAIPGLLDWEDGTLRRRGSVAFDQDYGAVGLLADAVIGVGGFGFLQCGQDLCVRGFSQGSRGFAAEVGLGIR